ncbi:MAG TPA: F0F1 ATP synthase subunit B [Gemmatimonadaceae bacterium]|nr:F0F1 ATP synthase subunit B [Gemmatimonadaceae bacterium]
MATTAHTMTPMRIRILSYTALLSLANAGIAFAQEHGAEGGETYALTDIRLNLMFYTLITFLATFWVLKRYAFPPMFKAVEAREKALEEAIEGAKRDRDAAAALLAQQQAQLDASRGEGQKLIADARAVAEKMRTDLLEQTRKDQGDLLERAKRDIAGERDKAIAQLRREAVELAIVGASKVIEENLDSDKNRKLVETYLSSIGTNKVTS